MVCAEQKGELCLCYNAKNEVHIKSLPAAQNTQSCIWIAETVPIPHELKDKFRLLTQDGKSILSVLYKNDYKNRLVLTANEPGPGKDRLTDFIFQPVSYGTFDIMSAEQDGIGPFITVYNRQDDALQSMNQSEIKKLHISYKDTLMLYITVDK